MSGIAALIRIDGGDADARALEVMTDAMDYRGPDGVAQWNAGPAALGHCAMHTSAESLDCAQPLANEETSAVLVMDGYVGNYDELRTDLMQRGARLRSRSDAELVLRAYEQWGADCAAHIDGEYAFVIWDKRRQEAICARDHHGLRPLFWHFDGAQLALASDIAAIMAILIEAPPLNMGYLAEVAVDETFSPDETVWQGIHRLRNAHTLTFNANGPQSRSYWTLPTKVTIRHKSDGEFAEHYLAVLSESVRRASRTHLPLAFEVSGGLDSSALFGVAHQLELAGQLPAPSIAGYTLAGPVGSYADELEYARAVGKHLGRELTEVPLYKPGLDWFAQRSRDDCDMAPFPNAAMSIGMDAAIRGDGSRVAINGVGGDQWLDGTQFYYRELFNQGQWRELLAAYREDVAGLGFADATKTLLRLGPGSYLPRSLRRLRKRINDRNTQAMPDWLRPELQTALSQRQARYEATFPAEYRDSYKLRKLTLPRWTQVLDLISRQRARGGLENRSPMMSRPFIEFSAATPERIRRRGGVTKYIHRKALAGIIPSTVATRISKAEFSTVYHALDEDLRHDCLEHSAKNLTEIAEISGLKRLFDKYRDAAIDERCTGEVWGIYVCAQILKLNEEFRVKG